MSNFIKIPAQQSEDGDSATSECLINLDTVFMVRSHELDGEYIINFMLISKETFNIVFFEEEQRDLWYNKISNLIINEI